MSYKSFSPCAEALSTSPCIHQLRMRVLVHQLSLKNFSINADRVAMKDQLANIETHFDLFSATKRFPDNGFYVFLDLDDWNKKWQDLQSALDFKSSEKDPKKYPKSQLQISSNNQDNEDKMHWDFNDASQVFRNTLRIMSNQLGTLEGLLDRSKFEDTFHAVWQVNLQTDEFFDGLNFGFRPRGFVVDPLNLENDTWPGVNNVNTLAELVDIAIDNDYIFIWGSRSNTDRPRLRIDVLTRRIIECRSIITAD